MITKTDLISALQVAAPLFEKLQDLYRKMPETRCDCEEPGVCCRFLPEMTTLEALGWIRLLLELPDEALAQKLRKFVEFYFRNPAQFSGCPFLENGGCSVYEFRTFGCRAYGSWSQKLGKRRTQESRKEKKALRQMWKRFGIELPADIVEFEIDYCNKVETLSDSPPSDKDLMDLLQQIYDLDASLKELQEKFENEYHSDFSLLITSLALGMKKALLEKFAVVKEIVQDGTDTRLQKTLETISSEVLRP
jgi:Fe-S-cluster containining protein